jgi:protein-disulfide isomerase
MASRLENTVNVAIAIAAVTVALAVARRELGDRNQRSNERFREQADPVYISDWQRMLADGVELGPTDAHLRISEFVDLECPYCAEWHSTVLLDVLKEHGRDIGLTMMHFPLPGHRFARQAAVALECAAAQGRVADFLKTIYAKQDSTGLKSWWSYAQESLVSDSTRFGDCMSGPAPTRIEAGQRWAKRVGVNSTPTFIVNGWLLARSPDRQELSDFVRASAAGEKPFAK